VQAEHCVRQWGGGRWWQRGQKMVLTKTAARWLSAFFSKMKYF
jgi:hypothetical protein